MNRVELKKKLRSVMSQLVSEKRVISPVEVLLGAGSLSVKDVEDWRFGRVTYLEKVCRGNLSAMSFIMCEIKSFADVAGLKPPQTVYVRWGTSTALFEFYGKESSSAGFGKNIVSSLLESCKFKRTIPEKISS